ncbi:MAG TPA: carboxypeptidase-like regulatory domain-containing protein [Opitutaceae bacterium]|nr:carboxypeptidase-like regulatory domain-containing protein [Opitutaceae bacterium]
MTRWSAPGYPSPFSRIWLALAVVAAAATPLLAGDILVKSAGSDALAAPPGQIVTLSWLLKNTSSASCALREHFVLPSEWRLAPTDEAPDGAIILAPGASTLRLAALMVPSSAPAGGYLIGCNWTRADDPAGAVVATGQVEVTVQNSDKLELTADKVPMMAVSGEPYTVTLDAFNRGNSVLHVWAIAVAATGSQTTVSPAQFTLKPGAVMPIQVRVTPPKDLTHSITVALRGTVTANSGATANADVFTEVYTTAATEEAPAWPSLFTTQLIHDPGLGNRAEVGLEGSSRADDGSTLSYLLRSAGTNDAGFFRDPEQYSVDYKGQNVSWKAGNEIYSLSPLTTRPQFGSGGAFTLAGDTSWSGGAFAMRSRESASVENQAGAYASYELDNDVTLTGNVLQKTEGRLQDFAGKRDATVSAEATYAGGPELEGQMEIGATPQRPEGAKGSPFAERLAFDGNPGDTKYAVTAENYGEAYFGALRQARILEGTLSQAISPQLDLRTEDNFRSYSNAFSLPGERVASNKESAESGGITWHPTKLIEFSLDAVHADRSFDFTATPTRYLENTLEFGARKTFEHFMLATTIGAGSLTVREGDVQRSPVQRTNTSAMWTPDARHDVSVFVSTGNDPYSPVAAHTRTYGGSAHAQLTPHLSATVQAGENVYDSRNAARRSYFFAEAGYQFQDHQTVALRVTRSGKAPGSDGHVAFSVSYTRPLNLPAPALSARCKVTGTLVDAVSGDPLRRVVVVLNGRTAVTDNKGRYAFTQLKPGTYTLAVDPHSLGTERLIVEKLPITVRLERGDAQQVALSAEEAGKVFVQFSGSSADFPGVAAAAVGGILVHLIRQEDGSVLSELTNEQGKASFYTVRPGKWQVKVDPQYVPSRYEATVSDSVVNVSSDGTEQVAVGMKYQAPEIRWIATN